MNYFFDEQVTKPERLPVTVTAAQEALAAATVEEIELGVLWRAVVSQTRSVTVDGALPQLIEIEPTTSIISLTRWAPDGAGVVVDVADYVSVSRDPKGTLICAAPGKNWPAPLRPIGSFSLVYAAGWEVSANENLVPASIVLMISKAVEYRAGGSGFEAIRIGGMEMDQSDSYRTDRLPRELTDIARGWFFRPGLFAGRP